MTANDRRNAKAVNFEWFTGFQTGLKTIISDNVEAAHENAW